jgi:hypothetical protein
VSRPPVHRRDAVVYAGPLSSWSAVCDRLLGMDVETVIPEYELFQWMATLERRVPGPGHTARLPRSQLLERWRPPR